MKKIILIFLILGALTISSRAQLSPAEISHLKQLFLTAKEDSSKLNQAFALAAGYRFSNVDSSLFYSDLGLALADKLDLPAERAKILSLKGATLLESGRLPESLQFQFEALNISESIDQKSTVAYALNRIGNTYMELADYRKANEYYFRSKDLFQEIGDTGMFYNEISNIGNIYDLLHMPDSALYYQNKVYKKSLTNNDRVNFTRPEIMFRMGNAYRAIGDTQHALEFYKKGIIQALIDNDIRDLTMNNLFLAQLYHEMNLSDSSMKYAYQAIANGEIISFRKGLYESSKLLSELFRKNGQYDSAYRYLLKASVEKDSLHGTARFQDMQHVILNQQEMQQELQVERRQLHGWYRTIAISAAFLLSAFGAIYLWRNNRKQKKVNATLLEQQQQISSQNIELAKTLNDLKSTQSLLIQSEKMASLGELTAGIAHEIQNPLNFVNNFSEVNKELLVEMNEEIEKGNLNAVKTISKDVIDNEEKINHHGKRADAIVKGMLQHSRSSSGVKEPADINTLADEYLRLAYHGLRAKDKTFNATLKTDYDPSIGVINVLPQDIGRTILNLITNAFYAVTEKKKQVGGGYNPTVQVNTKKVNGKVEIQVIDNGNGIPQKILDKIFQPFFTTKPTGQGTGLGLSLSYDIIMAHGGELKVETIEGEGSEFTIQLPAK
jgi:signal transduction histidine kinase